MLLNALTPPDTVPWVAEADLRDVSDAKEEALRQWDTRLTAIRDKRTTAGVSPRLAFLNAFCSSGSITRSMTWLRPSDCRERSRIRGGKPGAVQFD